MNRGRIVFEAAPDKRHPRHSEGDFARLPDGSILFVYSRFNASDGNDDAPCDLFALKSMDEGETWQELGTVVSAQEHGARNVMSVSLLPMDSGEIGLFYILKQDNVTNPLLLRRTSDGIHYSEAVRCDNPKRHARNVMNNSRVIRLANGRILLPSALHYCSEEGGKCFFNTYAEDAFFCSDDDGRTWFELPQIVHADFPNSDSGLQEPGVIELQNGVLWLYARTDRMFHYESFSMNGGISWTQPQPSRFTGPCSPMKIARNPYDGRLYAVWNPIPNYNGRKLLPGMMGRTPFAIACGNDAGEWSEPYLLEDDERSGYCYPALFFLSETEALLAYCAGGEGDGCCLNRLRMRKIGL